jgi:hypothetical protein
MRIREYWTKEFERELGELDEDDEEVLESTISFDETMEKIRRLF